MHTTVETTTEATVAVSITVRLFLFAVGLSSVEFSLVVSGSLLVLLVLGDEVVHVALSLGELHLVHTLTSVPMEESLATEHGRELLGDSLEQLLDGRAVSDEGGSHGQSARRNVTDGSLNMNGLKKLGTESTLTLLGIHSTK